MILSRPATTCSVDWTSGVSVGTFPLPRGKGWSRRVDVFPPELRPGTGGWYILISNFWGSGHERKSGFHGMSSQGFVWTLLISHLALTKASQLRLEAQHLARAQPYATSLVICADVPVPFFFLPQFSPRCFCFFKWGTGAPAVFWKP